MKIVKKNGKLYAFYKGKYFQLKNIKESELNDKDIIRDLLKIVKQVTKKRKQKKREKKEKELETSLKTESGIIKGSERITPIITPKVSTVDDPRLAKVLGVNLSHNETVKLQSENERLKRERDKIDNEKEVKMKLLPKAGEVKLLTHEGEELKIKNELYDEYKKYHEDISKYQEHISKYEDKITAYLQQSTEYEEEIYKKTIEVEQLIKQIKLADKTLEEYKDKENVKKDTINKLENNVNFKEKQLEIANNHPKFCYKTVMG